LHSHGLTDIQSSRQAAAALAPLAGRFSAILYSLGLIGVGMLAIPTLTGSAAYACAETFRWRQGLDNKWMRAKAFYAVIVGSSVAGIFLDFMNLNPIRALYWSAVINGLLAPFLLTGIFIVVRDRKIMAGHTATRPRQLVLFLTMVMMFGAAIGMFVI
jgi:Mn2+/Fe2+ NRAMP family transporter